MASPTSTSLERRSLDAEINLTDAHARMGIPSRHLRIVCKANDYLRQWEQWTQSQLENDFQSAFYRLCHQNLEGLSQNLFYSYSASCAIALCASLARRKGTPVTLVEPCFDNIPQLLASHSVKLKVLPEHEIGCDDVYRRIKKIAGEILWLVLPNNPTGFNLSSRQFKDICDACYNNGVLLVVDFCFRPFSETCQKCDHYQIARRSGVEFIFIEDTGKTWALADLKIGMVCCSDTLRPSIHAMHDDLLLNVSPFVLKMLTEIIELDIALGIAKAVWEPVHANRAHVIKLFEGTSFSLHSPPTNEVPIAWVELPEELRKDVLRDALLKEHLHILPGTNFFWSAPTQGDRFVRLPLSRRHAFFRRHLRTLVAIGKDLQGKTKL